MVGVWCWTIRGPNLNVVHTLNVVQLRIVKDDRRERARDARKASFLAAASAVIDRDGLDGLTMVAVADQLDCAVGTIYSYFPSKAALVVGLQSAAVDILADSHARAVESWNEALAADDLHPTLNHLVYLVGFAGFFAAASVVFADEFDLQRRLTSTLPPADDESTALTKEVIGRWTALPKRLLDAAVGAEVLEAGDNTDRACRWIAGLNGMLLLDRVSSLDRYLFRAPHHARTLTVELLRAWGAEPHDLAVAASHVERLAALGPLAPPPETD